MYEEEEVVMTQRDHVSLLTVITLLWETQRTQLPRPCEEATGLETHLR